VLTQHILYQTYHVLIYNTYDSQVLIILTDINLEVTNSRKTCTIKHKEQLIKRAMSAISEMISKIKVSNEKPDS
jgi:hypothetical protein